MKDILLAVSVLLVLWYIPLTLYVRFGLFRWLYHGVLKWHQPDKTKSGKAAILYVRRVNSVGKISRVTTKVIGGPTMSGEGLF